MAQEFTIKSQQIEDKINQLLPSQGGFQAGVDFSASTMVIPIVDLTETAEGSSLRQDLQTSLSHGTATTFNVVNTTSTIITTTGYFRIIGTFTSLQEAAATTTSAILLSDGTTDKNVYTISQKTKNSDNLIALNYDFNVFLEAGDSLKILSPNTSCIFAGSVRQIADINGNLTNP